MIRKFEDFQLFEAYVNSSHDAVMKLDLKGLGKAAERWINDNVLVGDLAFYKVYHNEGGKLPDLWELEDNEKDEDADGLGDPLGGYFFINLYVEENMLCFQVAKSSHARDSDINADFDEHVERLLLIQKELQRIDDLIRNNRDLKKYYTSHNLGI